MIIIRLFQQKNNQYLGNSHKTLHCLFLPNLFVTSFTSSSFLFKISNSFCNFLFSFFKLFTSTNNVSELILFLSISLRPVVFISFLFKAKTTAFSKWHKKLELSVRAYSLKLEFNFSEKKADILNSLFILLVSISFATVKICNFDLSAGSDTNCSHSL